MCKIRDDAAYFVLRNETAFSYFTSCTLNDECARLKRTMTEINQLRQKIIRRAYIQGDMSGSELAALLGISRDAVYHVAYRLGITKKRQTKLWPVQNDLVCKLWKTKSVREISKIVGITTKSVYRRAKRMGLRR